MKRNKKCINCPQNAREDIVWRKGFEDGREMATYSRKALLQKIVERLEVEKKDTENVSFWGFTIEHYFACLGFNEALDTAIQIIREEMEE